MGTFNPANYATVDERIADFYVRWPLGSIRTFVVAVDEQSILIEARLFRTVEEARDGIYTSGLAHEVQGSGPVNRTNHVENAETSAVGRALANLGFSGSVNGKRAPRSSREEMRQAGAREASHDAALDSIRSTGATCEEEAEIRIDGGTRNLKAYVRENWPALKENYARARAVLAAIEAA